MDTKRPMSLLMVEDDIIECNIFKQYVNSRDDVRFIGVTNSSKEGIDLIKTYIPEGIILDIELSRGQGSGLELLSTIKEINLDFRPVIIIITNTKSDLLTNYLHDYGVDFYFTKGKKIIQ